ncbi:MAG: hypothetical protein HKN12_08355, partial [Gemmatimonadetes bacterium]|nr:hypothetical protein [Gemmatimonadota bacterium]
MRRSSEHRNGRLVRPLALGTLLAVGLSGSVPGPAAAAPAPSETVLPAENLPPDHPAWRDLEFVWTRGGLTGLPLFTRPLVRGDIAAALRTTREDRPDLATSAPFRRLLREFAAELRSLGVANDFTETPPLMEFREGDARLSVRAEATGRVEYRDDDASVPEGTAGGLVARVILP